MSNKKFIALVKCSGFGIILAIIFILIGIFISNFSGYILKDILFIEGIISVIIGVFSLTSGNSMGLSMQSLGQSNSQYVSNSNLEVTKMEKERKHNSIGGNVKDSFNIISLNLGGIICLIASFIV